MRRRRDAHPETGLVTRWKRALCSSRDRCCLSPRLGFALVHAVGQDPQLVRVLGYVVGVIALILSPLGRLDGYMGIGLAIVVLLFLIARELGRIYSHLASLNTSVASYFEARRAADRRRGRDTDDDF